MDFQTADLCDRFAAELQIGEPVFRDYGGRSRFAGPIATIKCFEDNSRVRDLVAEPPTEPADVALLLKLVTTLDRQDPPAATRLLRGLDVRHAVVSFPLRSLGGRRTGMERSYRARLDRLVADVGRVREVTEASVANELLFVLSLDG